MVSSIRWRTQRVRNPWATSDRVCTPKCTARSDQRPAVISGRGSKGKGRSTAAVALAAADFEGAAVHAAGGGGGKHPPKSANTPPSLYKVPTYSTRVGAASRAPGGAHHGGGNRAVNSQPRMGQSTLYGDVKSSYGGAGGWDRRGCATWAPSSATRQGEEQHGHTERGSHTKGDKGGHTRQGGGAQQGRRGYQNGGNREPEWSGWWSVRQQRAWPGQPAPSLPGARATPAQPASGGGCLPQPRWAVCATGAGAHQGQTSREGEKDIWWTARKTRGGTGHLGRTETQRGRLWTAVDRGVWTAKTVKRPRQQPAHPQYANYWAPLTRKRHTMPHSAQPQHTKYWAPRTRKRHQQEHRLQRPTERSDPTQHAKGRTGDRPGPRKETTTRRNVTQGAQVRFWGSTRAVGSRRGRSLTRTLPSGHWGRAPAPADVRRNAGHSCHLRPLIALPQCTTCTQPPVRSSPTASVIWKGHTLPLRRSCLQNLKKPSTPSRQPIQSRPNRWGRERHRKAGAATPSDGTPPRCCLCCRRSGGGGGEVEVRNFP